VASCVSFSLGNISKREADMMKRTAFAILLALATSALAQEKAESKLKVVATFSILADFVKNVGGDRVAVTALVGPNGDAHVYQPTPSDAKTVADAKLVFTNGLGFEGWMNRLVKASGTKAPMIVATKGVKPRKMEEDGHAETDPHAWQSVANAKVYVANIRDGLVAADPAGKAAYEANANAYLAKLDALDGEVKAAIEKIAPDRRRIITTHDAFGYFAAAYGVAFIAPQGVSTEAEVSAKDVAKIIAQIRKQKLPAVFLENVTDDRLLKRIGAESGARVGGTLYSDALTDETGAAPTYLDMMRHNIKQLAEALTS
jgi:zinc/manganese transport system substrate-binding protein